MDDPIKTFDDFWLFRYTLPDGEERTSPMGHAAYNGPLPAEVEAEYRERFGDNFDHLYFVPLKPLGAVVAGALQGVETGKVVGVGRDLGHAMILTAPVTRYTQRAIGDATYLCLFPREDIYYRRRLFHNIEGLPNEPGYHPPVEEFEVPDRDVDQFVFVATGRVALLGGGAYGPLSLLKIPANSNGRLVGLIEPGTTVIYAWRSQ